MRYNKKCAYNMKAGLPFAQDSTGGLANKAMWGSVNEKEVAVRAKEERVVILEEASHD